MYRRLMNCLVAGFLAACASSALADDLTLKTGDSAPDFKATACCGTEVSLETFKDAKAVVVIFNCNSCPVAVAYEDRINELAKSYQDKGVAVVVINNHRAEDLEAMKQRSEEKGFVFPYVYDGSGDSARAYGAKVTPHCFVLCQDRKIAYQGAFDNDQKNPTEHYVIDAVNAVLEGKTVVVTYKPAFGCSIKFRSNDK